MLNHVNINRNSVLLLKSEGVQLGSISRYVLQPALHSKEQKVHEMLVIALSKICCYLSKCGSFKR